MAKPNCSRQSYVDGLSTRLFSVYSGVWEKKILLSLALPFFSLSTSLLPFLPGKRSHSPDGSEKKNLERKENDPSTRHPAVRTALRT